MIARETLQRRGCSVEEAADGAQALETGARFLPDLILVDGDPTRNISDIRKVSYVLKDGLGYAPAEIYEAFGIRRFVDPPAISR